jgi:hypothetical protein
MAIFTLKDAEEISKYPKWEDRGRHPGKSEGHVMLFNKGDKAIAAQWAQVFLKYRHCPY